MSTAFILFLVGFMESISISKALARRHSYNISVTQEIISLGIANLVGGMFGSYAATGSFSRSAVSADIGAKTQLQGAITGVLPLPSFLFGVTLTCACNLQVTFHGLIINCRCVKITAGP